MSVATAFAVIISLLMPRSMRFIDCRAALELGLMRSLSPAVSDNSTSPTSPVTIDTDRKNRYMGQ